jgi:hypothetical protein
MVCEHGFDSLRLRVLTSFLSDSLLVVLCLHSTLATFCISVALVVVTVQGNTRLSRRLAANNREVACSTTVSSYRVSEGVEVPG